MGKPKYGREITFKRTISDKPMSEDEYQEAESILAKLVARAYIRDYPELFCSKLQQVGDEK